MKTPYLYLFMIVSFLGCQNGTKLVFDPLVVQSDICESCPEVLIEIPHAEGEGKLSNTINSTVQEEIATLLSFDDELQIRTIDDALVSFKKGYVELQQRYDDEPTGWEAKIKGEVTFENESYITIMLDAYIYTGGAHGYSSNRFLNFDKKKGIPLDNLELFENVNDFLKFAETMFREKESIPADKSINYTGLMFEGETFYLPENIGFTKKGLKLLYNPYEVASYADGTIELVLPHNKVKKYLVEKNKS